MTMTTLRLLSYNILMGGTGRLAHIERICERSQADIVILQEAIDDSPLLEMAGRLGMKAICAPPSPVSSSHVVILSRVPIDDWRVHQHPDMLRYHLECDVTPSPRIGTIRIHGIHLAARFGERANGEVRRLKEIGRILDDIHREDDVNHHLLMGDFNSIAPKDVVRATLFFERLRRLKEAGLFIPDEELPKLRSLRVRHLRGRHSLIDSPESLSTVGIAPHLAPSIQPLPNIAMLATSWMPVNHRLDLILGRGIRRWTVQKILDNGFSDCYRLKHPRTRGFTCATWVPATRIDYAFVTKNLVPYVDACDVVGSLRRPDRDVQHASDHFPLYLELHFPPDRTSST
ncbi:MAG: endonuclease/exonuclease/phosphatase family protein [Candidatus Dormibacteria bacterium]